MSEDEIDRRHHQCSGHELGQTSGDGEGQGGLACCRPWGCKELETTRRLNDNSNNKEIRQHFHTQEITEVITEGDVCFHQLVCSALRTQNKEYFILLVFVSF